MLAATLAAALAACHRPSPDAAAAPMFTDDHGLLSVPAGSSLRTHLVVQAVGGGDRAAIIELPAQIEADPARVANVPGPLTAGGRPQGPLGQRVRRGQVLAVLASGDTAGASPTATSRRRLETARKALVRARGVKEAGGAARRTWKPPRARSTRPRRS